MTGGKRNCDTYLSTYSLSRFAIRMRRDIRSVDQFSWIRFSYNCRSQWGIKTIVGIGSGYAAF